MVQHDPILSAGNPSVRVSGVTTDGRSSGSRILCPCVEMMMGHQS